MAVRIGVDVGGTFTDLYLLDDEAQTYATHKVPTTPADPSVGIVTGVLRLLEARGIAAARLSHLSSAPRTPSLVSWNRPQGSMERPC